MRRLMSALLLYAAPCVAQEALEIRQFDIPTLERLGHDIYVQDQAAWHATDALLATHSKATLQTEKVNGFLVEQRPAGVVVRFMRNGDGGPEAAYDVHYASGANFAHDEPTISVPTNRTLTADERARNAARKLALASITQRCGDNYNTVVLKDPQGEGWLVWALAATTNPNLVMAGGHLRLTVSADGTSVMRRDALSRTCAVMSKDAQDGKSPVALMSTQLVSNVPVETFVFLSLEHHMPFFVATSDRKIWKVEDGHIVPVNLPGH